MALRGGFLFFAGAPRRPARLGAGGSFSFPDCRLPPRGAAAPIRDRAVRVRRPDRARHRGRQRDVPNIPYPVGSELAARLTHLFEMKDGKIVREIAYEMWREEGAPNRG